MGSWSIGVDRLPDQAARHRCDGRQPPDVLVDRDWLPGRVVGEVERRVAHQHQRPVSQLEVGSRTIKCRRCRTRRPARSKERNSSRRAWSPERRNREWPGGRVRHSRRVVAHLIQEAWLTSGVSFTGDGPAGCRGRQAGRSQDVRARTQVETVSFYRGLGFGSSLEGCRENIQAGGNDTCTWHGEDL
jgi:hypothetical protein